MNDDHDNSGLHKLKHAKAKCSGMGRQLVRIASAEKLLWTQCQEEKYADKVPKCADAMPFIRTLASHD